MPPAIAPPGVECAVIARLEHRVKDIATVHYVSAESAIANVDTRARHCVDRTVGYADFGAGGEVNPGRLLLKTSGLGDQAVVDKTIPRVLVAFWSRRSIDPIERGLVVVAKEGVA